MNWSLENNTYTAFGGQVTFETEPYLTPLVYITIERIQEAIPEHKKFKKKSMEELFFTDFVELMSQTVNIRFALTEESPVLLRRLQAFWEQASASNRGIADWRSLWELFNRVYDAGELRTEWNNAINTSIPANVAASPELATPLPVDETELENLPDDSPLSGHGKASSEKSSELSPTSENPEPQSTE